MYVCILCFSFRLRGDHDLLLPSQIGFFAGPLSVVPGSSEKMAPFQLILEKNNPSSNVRGSGGSQKKSTVDQDSHDEDDEENKKDNNSSLLGGEAGVSLFVYVCLYTCVCKSQIFLKASYNSK